MAEAVQAHHEGLARAADAEAVAIQLCLFLSPRLACLPEQPGTAEGSNGAAAAAALPAAGARAAWGGAGVAGGVARQTVYDGSSRSVLACAAALQVMLMARPQLLAEAAAPGGNPGSVSPVKDLNPATGRLIAAARSLYERVSRVVAVHAAAAAARLTRVRDWMHRSRRTAVPVVVRPRTATPVVWYDTASPCIMQKQGPACHTAPRQVYRGRLARRQG